MSETQNLKNSKCPLCQKQLASHEYLAAIKELEKKVQESYDEKNNHLVKEYEKQIAELKEHQELLFKNQKENHENEIKRLEEDISESYKKQLEMMEKNYETMATQGQKQFTNLQKQLESNHKKDLDEKEKQFIQLRKEQSGFKKSVIEATKAEFDIKSDQLYQEIRERDIQLNRFKDEVDGLKKQLTQNQSELKGEAGELNLRDILTEAFPMDHFRRQKRGTSSGDLIQRIRTRIGILDVPIVYDNKAANQVTKKDIAKCKEYKKIHGTNYVLIVSQNLPKTSVPNGLFGERDGVILVHPKIVTEVAKQIRTAIIDISKLSTSKQDQNGKETRLYQYIISQEFSMHLESIAKIQEIFYNMQNKEEKDHQVLWKSRRELYDQLVRAYNDLSSGIESITQTDFSDLTQKIKSTVGEK